MPITEGPAPVSPLLASLMGDLRRLAVAHYPYLGPGVITGWAPEVIETPDDQVTQVASDQLDAVTPPAPRHHGRTPRRRKDGRRRPTGWGRPYLRAGYKTRAEWEAAGSPGA
jgi:hypothetical protein